jgi:hypothetical protein
MHLHENPKGVLGKKILAQGSSAKSASTMNTIVGA